MAHGRSALRSGASLVAALIVAGTLSGAVAAAQSGIQRVGSTTPTTQPASAPKVARSAPALRKRTAERRGSVNVRRLATQKPAKRPRHRSPHPSLSRVAGGTTKPGLSPKAIDPRVVAAALPLPTPATSNSDGPAAQPGFDGLAQAPTGPTNGEPPDPWVAAGPEHVVQAVNLELRMTDRQGAEKKTVDLPSFFLLPTVPDTFDTDPHIIYDSLHGRWLATEVSWDCDTGGSTQFGTSYLDVATSRTSDPTGLWDVVAIPFPDQFLDFPAPGTSTDKVAVASNALDMSADAGGDCVKNLSFAGGDIEYMDWADLLDGGDAAVQGFIDTDWITPRVAVQAPATSATLQQVTAFAGGTPPLGTLDVAYFTTTGSVTKDTILLQPGWNLTGDGVVTGFADPPVPIQPGGTISDAVDLRPTDAIWQGNRLVYVSTYPCGTGPRDCVRVTELNTTGAGPTKEPSLTQDFLVAENGKDLYMGGIGLTGNGTLHVGWTRSSASRWRLPSSYAAHQVVGDAPNSISAPELLAAGTAAYPGTRWGDYVGIAQDPQVPNQAWNANQYSVGAPGWATKVTPLRPAGTTYVPIAPVRVLDTRTTTGGLKGGFTSGSPRSWPVRGVGGIPAGAVAVTGNVTVTGQTAGGFVSVTVSPTSTPPSSTINFPTGETRANNLTIPLNSDGKLSATFKSGSGKKTQLVFDVTGYFLADDSGATFSPLATPVRALDTRIDLGLPGDFHANLARTLAIAGPVPALGVPSTATAITGNLTIVHPTQSGFAAVTKDPTNSPTTSTINVPGATTRANGVFAPLDGTGSLSIVYKTSGSAPTTDFVFDITGYFEPGLGGLRFVPMTPSRIMDSRPSVVLSGLSGKFVSGTPRTLPVQGHWGVPASALAVTANLTVTGQTAAGFVAVTPDPTPTPATSTINFPKGSTMANGIVAPLNGAGETSFVYKTATGRRT